MAYRRATVSFPELYLDETRTVKLTYTVKGGKPRSETSTRTMKAFASFCAIANGADGGSVTVRLPKGFAVSATGERLRARIAGKERVLSSGKIRDPEDWFACFTGTNTSGYRTEKLAHDGQTIHLRSWPEDPAWATGVRADIATSLPLLERLTGSALEGDGEARLAVQESATGAQYAGFYDAETRTVTVGEDYGQPALVEHELAHVWFNRSVFKEAWLSEGLAEWAGRAVSDEAGACARPSGPAGSVDLAEWRYLAPRSTAAERDGVATQYQAACWVVTAVAGAAGGEGMTAAVNALLERRDPYAADRSALRASRVATWKDWLDAVDELALAPAGVGETLASDLLVEYGVADDAALLATRAEARRAYRELVAVADGWVVPRAVRAPLAAWDFRKAGTAIEAARRTWELTGETDAVLAGVDARHGPAAEAWARATGLADLRAAADLAERQLAAARDVAEAKALVNAPLDIAQQVGLFGTEVPSVDAAIPAVRAGDGDTAAAITAEVRATVAGLRAVGQQRITVGGVLGAALLAVLAAGSCAGHARRACAGRRLGCRRHGRRGRRGRPSAAGRGRPDRRLPDPGVDDADPRLGPGSGPRVAGPEPGAAPRSPAGRARRSARRAGGVARSRVPGAHAPRRRVDSWSTTSPILASFCALRWFRGGWVPASGGLADPGLEPPLGTRSANSWTLGPRRPTPGVAGGAGASGCAAEC